MSPTMEMATAARAAPPGGLAPAGWTLEPVMTKAAALGGCLQVLLAAVGPGDDERAAEVAREAEHAARDDVRRALARSAVIARYARMRAEVGEARARVAALESEAAGLEADGQRLMDDAEVGLTSCLADLGRRQADVAARLAEAGAVAGALERQLAEVARRASGAVREVVRVANLAATRRAREAWEVEVRQPLPPEVTAIAGRLAGHMAVIHRGSFDQLGGGDARLLEALATEAAEAEAVGVRPG